MAIVTFERVKEIAETLLKAGSTPTIIKVQNAIGGGSYTTVKRYLDQWHQERFKAAPEDLKNVPEELLTLSNQLALQAWQMANSNAQVVVDEIQEKTDAALKEMKEELAGATEEILKLESALVDTDQVKADLQKLQQDNAITAAENNRLTELLKNLQNALELENKKVLELNQQLSETNGKCALLLEQNNDLIAKLQLAAHNK